MMRQKLLRQDKKLSFMIPNTGRDEEADDLFTFDGVIEEMRSASGLSCCTITDHKWHLFHPDAAKVLFCLSWNKTKLYIRCLFNIYVLSHTLKVKKDYTNPAFVLPPFTPFKKCSIAKSFFNWDVQRHSLN